MKLLTEQIKRKLPKIRSTESQSDEEKKVVVKFFAPWTNWTWYVLEGEYDPELGWVFFGIVDGFEVEYGEFYLNDLLSVEGPVGLKIERDLYFGHPTVAELRSKNII